MTTTLAVQSAIIAHTVLQSSIVSLLPSADEVRELEFQGEDFTYPNVRVSVILHPSINGCSPDRAEVFFDVFSDEKSSRIAQTVAAAIQTIYHRRTFEQDTDFEF